MFEIIEELPPVIVKWTTAYEQEYGKQPTKQSIRIVAYFERLSTALVDLGHNDAEKGHKPLSFSVFYDLTRSVIVGRTAIAAECVQIYAKLIQDSYMTGYDGRSP